MVELTEGEIRFLLKVIIESRNIHGADLQEAVLAFDKLQKKLRELNNVQ